MMWNMGFLDNAILYIFFFTFPDSSLSRNIVKDKQLNMKMRQSSPEIQFATRTGIDT